MKNKSEKEAGKGPSFFKEKKVALRCSTDISLNFKYLLMSNKLAYYDKIWYYSCTKFKGQATDAKTCT
jgi:hypothetical protein